MAKKTKEKPVRTDSLIDYVREEQRTFKQKPFCIEDSLVLSVLAYFDFEGFVPKASICRYRCDTVCLPCARAHCVR